MHRSFKGPHAWFALSAYAFPIQPIGGQQGWTILRPAHDEKDEIITGSHVLWEMFT